MHAHALAAQLTTLLDADRFRDYGPNGLQVANLQPLATLATSATASLAAIRFAQIQGAQALLVHHGLFWGREQRLVGMLGDRVRTLIQADLALIAYHLPLDAHPEHGNNAVALAKLGITASQAFAEQDIGRGGALAAPCSPQALIQRCRDAFAHEVLHCPGGPAQIQRVAVVTGAGQGHLRQAAEAGYDALVTGETSEQTWHEAEELGIHCFACGHHATEDHAVHALGALMASRFGLKHIAYRPDIPV